MNSGSCSSSAAAAASCANSLRLILPIRSASELIPDCSARIRVASWSADISRLKNATLAPTDSEGGMPSCMSRIQRRAALKAMLVASEVLPMPGRPARIIKSDRCIPPILALTESRPVVMPETWPPEFSARSAFFTAMVVAWEKLFTAFSEPPSAATLNSSFSASSICARGFTSSEVSIARSTSVRPTVTSARSIARS